MNRSSLVLAVALASALGAGLYVLAGRTPEAAGPDAAIGTPLPHSLAAAPLAPGPGQIRGRTAPGAVVRAFAAWAPSAADPAEEDCPCDGECGRASTACSCAALRARAEALVESHRRASVPLATATAGPDGAFALGGLAPETTADLWVEGDGGVGWGAGVAVGSTGVELALEPGAMLGGRLSLSDGTAPGEVPVWALSDGFGRLFEGTSDASGRVALGPVPASAWRVTAASGDLRGSARLGPGEAEFDLRLEAQGRVAGMVLHRGAKATGASVRLDAARCHLETRTDADGRFSATGLASGGVVVSAESGGHTAAVGLVLGPGERREDVVLDLDVATSLGGAVRGADGKTVAGAEVSYWLRRESSAGVPGLPIARRTATSGADGTWSAEPVAPGPYSLRATAPGFAESDVARVEVAAGGRGRSDFVLRPQALLAGRVVDPQGRPVEGAELTVRQEDGPPGPSSRERPRAERMLQRRRATVRTTADGAFRVEGLAAGPYTVSAEKEGYGHRPEVLEAPGEQVEIRLLAAGSVRGVVLDEGGGPAAGALLDLSLSVPRERRSGPAGKAHRRTAHADAAGTFRLADLADGPWLLEAVPKDSPTGEAAAYAASQVEVAVGAEVEVRLRLARTLSVSGSVVDGAGRPVAGARVGLSVEDRERRGTPRMPATRSATTGADGAFAVPGLPAGRYRVTARKELFEPARLDGVQAGAQDARLVLEGMSAVRGQVVDPQGRPLAAFEVNGEPVADPEGRFAVGIRRMGLMTLTVAAPGFAPVVRSFLVAEGKNHDAGRIVLSVGRRIDGRVLEKGSGAPVAGARVHVGEERPAGIGLGGEPEGAGPATDESGGFTMQVEEGTALLRVTHPRYKAASVEVGAATSRVEVALVRGAILRGRVLDLEGRPQRALLFATSKEGGRALTEVGADGTFLLGGLVGGRWLVSAAASDGLEQGSRLQAEVDLPEGGEASVVLRPAVGGAALVVRLTGPGAPPNGCGGMLVPVPEAGRAVPVGLPPSARSQEGVLTFRGLEPGSYNLLVSCGAGQRRSQVNEAVDYPGKGEQRIEVFVPQAQ